VSVPLELDFYNNKFYIINKGDCSIFNQKGIKMNSWNLPPIKNLGTFGASIKIVDDIIYLTLSGHHQIFLYSLDGSLLKTYGQTNASDKQGEFNQPYGLTICDKYIYVCDYYNNRIQILNKESGSFVTQWGVPYWGTNRLKFNLPFSIHYYNGLVYVGDKTSIQIITLDGKLIQRIGDEKEGKGINQFNEVNGIEIRKDILFAVDCGNHRIKTFRLNADFQLVKEERKKKNDNKKNFKKSLYQMNKIQKVSNLRKKVKKQKKVLQLLYQLLRSKILCSLLHPLPRPCHLL